MTILGKLFFSGQTLRTMSLHTLQDAIFSDIRQELSLHPLQYALFLGAPKAQLPLDARFSWCSQRLLSWLIHATCCTSIAPISSHRSTLSVLRLVFGLAWLSDTACSDADVPLGCHASIRTRAIGTTKKKTDDKRYFFFSHCSFCFCSSRYYYY